MVLEVMGRYSGQIALHTAVAAGAHAALIPEIPFDYAVLEERLSRRQKLGASSYLMIVAEGAHPLHQDLVQKVSPTGTTLLGGIGDVVAREIFRRTGIDARTTVLGHLQRGGAPSPADRLLGALLGKRAVDLVAQKRYGQLVGWNQGRFVEISYDSVGDARRRLDLSDPLVETAEAQGITLGRPSTYRGLI
jgi:6-phosphofructokinase 1